LADTHNAEKHIFNNIPNMTVFYLCKTHCRQLAGSTCNLVEWLVLVRQATHAGYLLYSPQPIHNIALQYMCHSIRSRSPNEEPTIGYQGGKPRETQTHEY
jgi:hypothetical protein